MEILKGFVFDIQRFASSATALDLGEVKTLGLDANKVLYLDDGVLKAADTLPDGKTKLADYTHTGLKIALVDSVTTVDVGADNDTDYDVTAGSAAVKLVSGSNSMTFQAGKSAKITASATPLTIATTNTTSTVIVGTVKIPNGVNADVSAAGASVTYSADITNVDVTTSDGSVLKITALEASTITSDGVVTPTGGNFAKNDQVVNGDVTAKFTAGGTATSVTFVSGGVGDVKLAGTGSAVLAVSAATGKGGTLGTGFTAVATTGVAPTVTYDATAAVTVTATAGTFSAMAAGALVDSTNFDVTYDNFTWIKAATAGQGAVTDADSITVTQGTGKMAAGSNIKDVTVSTNVYYTATDTAASFVNGTGVQEFTAGTITLNNTAGVLDPTAGADANRVLTFTGASAATITSDGTNLTVSKFTVGALASALASLTPIAATGSTATFTTEGVTGLIGTATNVGTQTPTISTENDTVKMAAVANTSVSSTDGKDLTLDRGTFTVSTANTTLDAKNGVTVNDVKFAQDSTFTYKDGAIALSKAADSVTIVASKTAAKVGTVDPALTITATTSATVANRTITGAGVVSSMESTDTFETDSVKVTGTATGDTATFTADGVKALKGNAEALTAGAVIATTNDTVTAVTKNATVTGTGTDLALNSGEFTTTTTDAISVTAGVKVNGHEFKGGTGTFTYTYAANDGSVAVLNTGGSIVKSANEALKVGNMAFDKAAVATFDATTLSGFTAGTLTVDAATDISWTAGANAGIVVLDDFIGKVQGNSDISQALTFDTFTGGKVTTGTGVSQVTIGEDVYVNGTNANMTLAANSGSYGLEDGSIKAATGKVYNIMNGSSLAQKVNVAAAGDGVVVAVKTGTGKASFTGLTEGESVTITESGAGGATSTYTYVSDTKVRIDNGTTSKLYTVTTTGGTAAHEFSLGVTTGLTEATLNSIKTADVKTTTMYDADGNVVTSASEAAVTVTVESDKRSVSVSKTYASGVDTTDDTITVTDSGTITEYKLADKSNVTAAGATFTTTKGVVSNATGTLALVGATDKLTAKGTVNVDVSKSSAADALTYETGAKIEGARVYVEADKYITLTEDNSTTGAVATVFNGAAKTVTGVEAGSTIATSGVTSSNLASISVVGSGTYTISGTEYTVASDDNGVVFEYDKTTADKVATISGLDKDATVTISKIATDSFTVNGTAFSDIAVKNDVVFSGADAARSAATITVGSKGDKVTIGGTTYEVESVGGASDNVVIGADTLGALNDGDKVKVTKSDGTYYTYSVSGNTMIVNNYDSADKLLGSKTWTMNDGDSGFAVSAATSGTVKNGSEGSKTVVAFGTETSGTAASTELSNGVYVNADGTLSTDSSKAVAQVGVADDGAVTYTSTSNKGQVVNVGNVPDNWNITTGSGKDVVAYAGSGDVAINTGAGNDNINVSGKGDATITVDSGKNDITVSNSGDRNITLGTGKDTLTVTGTGDVVVNANAGDNVIDLGGKTAGDSTITGGSGNDTITTRNEDDVVSGGAGKDTFVVGNGIKISDYNFSEDVILSTGGYTLDATGKIKNAAGGEADITAGAGDFYAAQIKTAAGAKAVNVAWAKEGGSNIDVTFFAKDVVVSGDADGVNTLYTGAGDDVIISKGDGDSVFGGAGKDAISLATGKEKRTVGISTTSGKDTVTGFNATFEDEGDSIFMVDGGLSDIKMSLESVSGGVGQATFKDGSSSSLTMSGVKVNSTTNAAEIKVGTAKAAVIAAGTAASVDSSTYANAFIGDKSAIDFSQNSDDLSVNLANGLTGDTSALMFSGIASVTGGSGKNTLIGSSGANLIVAGTGESSLYGGAGKDTLVGNTGSKVDFYFGDGTDSNVITGFKTADQEVSDKLVVMNDLASARLVDGSAVISTADGSKASISGMTANSQIAVEAGNFKGIAKIGESSKANSFSYDAKVNAYVGGSATDKVSVASGFSDNAEVWLDGSKGTAYLNVDAVDFSNGSGNYVLAGDSSKNTIVGGKGENSLWGGSGSSADSIKGGAGTNSFFYGFGEGNDTISSSNADDSVNLYNIKLSDVKTGEITNAGVMVEMNDGSKLTVATSKNITFKLASGETYVANHNTKGWDQA